MNDKELLKKIDQQLRKKRTSNLYIVLALITICIILSGILFYNIGNNEGYNKKTQEIKSQEHSQTKTDLMRMDVGEVWDIYLKTLMIQTMYLVPWIIGALLLGWIVHGIL